MSGRGATGYGLGTNQYATKPGSGDTSFSGDAARLRTEQLQGLAIPSQVAGYAQDDSPSAQSVRRLSVLVKESGSRRRGKRNQEILDATCRVHSLHPELYAIAVVEAIWQRHQRLQSDYPVVYARLYADASGVDPVEDPDQLAELLHQVNPDDGYGNCRMTALCVLAQRMSRNQVDGAVYEELDQQRQELVQDRVRLLAM